MSGPPSLDFGGEATPALERVGARDCFGRELFVLALQDFASLSGAELPASRFACVVACDADAVRRESLLAFARGLIERGAVIVSAWGAGCDDLAQAVEEAAARAGAFDSPERSIAATVHAGERLDEALDYLFRDALPAPAWEADCRAAVAISVGHPEWIARMRAWLAGTGEAETDGGIPA